MTTAVASGLSPVRSVLANGAVVIVQETAFDAGRDDQRHCPCRRRVRARPTAGSGVVGSAASSIAGRRSGRPRCMAEELDDRGVSLRITTNRHAMIVPARACRRISTTCSRSLLDVVRHPVFPAREVAKRRAE